MGRFFLFPHQRTDLAGCFLRFMGVVILLSPNCDYLYSMIESNPHLLNIMTRYPLVLFYQGDFRENPAHDLGEIVEKNLEPHLPLGLIRRIKYLILEIIQNVERYSVHVDHPPDFSCIFSDEHALVVVTQNVIMNRDVDSLRERLDSINSKQGDELKEAYMEVIQADVGTEKGAGLGLIDMARKSGNPLTYKFGMLDEERSTYLLKVVIPLADSEVSEEQIKENDRMLEYLLNKYSGNQTLFYSGDFSNNFLHTLLGMLKNTKGDDEASTNSEFQHILIELTQNILKHGEKQDDGGIAGYLSLVWKDQLITLGAGNGISEGSRLIEVIDDLNGRTLDELNKLNEETMLDFETKGGLGLINIAQGIHPNKIEYVVSDNDRPGRCIELEIPFTNE